MSTYLAQPPVAGTSFLDQLKALRREANHLTAEMQEPTYHAEPDAKYARALRKQKIEREITTLKRENIKKVYDAD